MRIYEESVGRNPVPQLNISPDPTGRVPEGDVAHQIGEELKRTVTTAGAKRIIKIPIPESVSVAAEVKAFRAASNFGLAVY